MSLSHTVSILFGFKYQALQNNQAILSKFFFSIFKESPGNANDEILILEQVFQFWGLLYEAEFGVASF